MNRYVILALLAAAVLVGVISSGCNRKKERDPALAQARQKNSGRKGSRKSIANSRPAEVLSASTQRTSQRQRQAVNRYNDFGPIPPITQSAAQYAYSNPSQRVETTYAMASPSFPAARSFASATSGYEPLPEPVPVSQLQNFNSGVGTYDSAHSYGLPLASAAQVSSEYSPPLYQTSVYQPAAYQPASYQFASYQPEPMGTVIQPEPAPSLAQSYPAMDYLPPLGAYYDPPVQIQVINHPTPELALARAVLDTAPIVTGYIAPPPLPEVYIPSTYSPALPEPQNYCPPAPIPELEPVRYQRAAATPPNIPELTPGMMSMRYSERQQQLPPPLPEFTPDARGNYPVNIPASYPAAPAAGQTSPFTYSTVPPIGVEAPQDWTPSPTTAMTRTVYF